MINDNEYIKKKYTLLDEFFQCDNDNNLLLFGRGECDLE